MNKEVKESISKKLKGRTKSVETRNRMSAANLGKRLTDATKHKISISHQTRPPTSIETRLKQSISARNADNKSKNTVWINNGVISKRIDKDAIIPNGWYYGRNRKHS